MSKPYVYALIDTRDDAVFYVGKGRNRRMYQHELNAKSGKLGIRHDRIRDILAAGACVECRVLAEYDTDVEAFEAEKGFIAQFDGLTNQNAGGGGARLVGMARRNQIMKQAQAMLDKLVPFERWVPRHKESIIAVSGSCKAFYDEIKGALIKQATHPFPTGIRFNGDGTSWAIWE